MQGSLILRDPNEMQGSLLLRDPIQIQGPLMLHLLEMQYSD